MSSIVLQDRIDETPSGGALDLDKAVGEYQGPAVLRKPLVLQGHGTTLWAKAGPVLSIEAAAGVQLHDINVEITGTKLDASGPETCAIEVHPGCRLQAVNVTVRGGVIGLQGEEGEWRYPSAIRLGILKAGFEHEFRLRLATPISCRARSDIDGVLVDPEMLSPDSAELLIRIDPLAKGTRLRGNLQLAGPHLRRSIRLSGCVQKNDTDRVLEGRGELIWQPANTQEVLDLFAPEVFAECYEKWPLADSRRKKLLDRYHRDEIDLVDLKEQWHAVWQSENARFPPEAIAACREKWPIPAAQADRLLQTHRNREIGLVELEKRWEDAWRRTAGRH